MNNPVGAKSAKNRILRVLLYAFVIVTCVVTLYPYFVMFTTAAKTGADITSGGVLPQKWVWSNFSDVFKNAPVAKYIMNSVIVAGGATCVAILCGIPAAYALSRMKFRGQKVFLAIVIISQMFSPIVLLIGIYRIMVTFGLTDNLFGLILINAAFNQAFTIWLLRGTFMSISSDMEQAATIDGCSRFQAMVRVLLPMAAPGIVTTLIYVLINAWNEYTIAFVLIATDTKKPITVGINIFNGYNIIEWQYLFATSLFATIPVIILFIAIEKYLVSGLTAGGVKG